ncbi:MAG: hypothetical protein U0599_28015 [Vicinamibacteria bacterium]
MMLPRTVASRYENAAAPNAEEPAEAGEHHRLHEELPQDVSAAGPEGLANADFLDALGHRHEHDVHDDDAAHEEADGGDDEGHDVDPPRHVLPELHDALARLDGEVVGALS